MIKKDIAQYTELMIETLQGRQSIICKVAEDFWSRAQGLLFTPPFMRIPMGEIIDKEHYQGIFIKHCRAVHTMGMRYDIDIIYLSFVDQASAHAHSQFEICQCIQHLKPWRASLCRQAQHTVELIAGEIARRAIAVGDRVNVVSPITNQSI